MKLARVPNQLSEAQRWQLDDSYSSGERFAYALHEVVRLRAGQYDAPLLVRLVDHPFDGREELRHALDFVDDQREAFRFKEQSSILLCGKVVAGVLHRDVVERAAQMLFENRCLADLTSAGYQHYFALSQ